MKNITIVLSENEWVTILSALGKLPYDQSAKIIHEIQHQGTEQLKKGAQLPEEKE